MSTTFDILANGASATDFVSAFVELEVEENADLPGAFSLTLPVTRTDTGDLDVVGRPAARPACESSR